MIPTYPLTVVRNRGWFGKVRMLKIFVDTPRGPELLGRVKQGETIHVNVPQDAVQIYSKMDYTKSSPLDLTFMTGGETVYANAWFTLNPLRNVGILQVPMSMDLKPRD